MKGIIILNLLVLVNVALSLPVNSTSNNASKPHRHPHAEGREFKGQFSQNGGFKVHLTLLPPPVDTLPDRAISGRQYVSNNSEERDSNGYIRVKPLKPPYISPYLIPVLLGAPGKSVHQPIVNRRKQSNARDSPPKGRGSGIEGQYVPDNREKQYDDGSDKSKPAEPRLVNSPYGTVPAGSGGEGQYVPDNNEKRYDDGSDKAQVAKPRLVDTPKGPVPAGSGQEGQYVPDNNEKRYNDGSDKAEVAKPRPIDKAEPAGSGQEGQYVPDNPEKRFDDGSNKSDKSPLRTTLRAPTPPEPIGHYIPVIIGNVYDDGADKAKASDSLNSVFSGEDNGRNVDGSEKHFDDGLYKPKGLERSFDDGLYKPKNLEKGFDDGLYRPEELTRRFDDGLIK